MLAALLDAADRGVKVSIVTDGVPYVTSIWGNPYFLALAGQENVEIKIYNHFVSGSRGNSWDVFMTNI